MSDWLQWLGDWLVLLFWRGGFQALIVCIVLVGMPFRWLYDRLSAWKQVRG
jgi:hypothetical protein